MKKIVTIAAIAGLLFSVTGAFAQPQKETTKGLTGKLSMGGSTTVEPIITSAIEEYNAKNPGVEVSYDAQGSSVGIKGALDGIYALGGSSREVKSSEFDSGAVAHTIALDGLAVVANGGVAVDNLSLAQVADIFSGKITNWKEVGGPDAEIVIINRDEASGTRAAFLELVIQAKLGKEAKFLGNAIIVESNGDMVTKVGSTPNAIGYCGFGYIEQARNMKAKTLLVDKVEPTVKNVLNKSYPVSRSLFLVSKGEIPAGSIAEDFLAFLLGSEGQKIVKNTGFIALP